MVTLMKKPARPKRVLSGFSEEIRLKAIKLVIGRNKSVSTASLRLGVAPRTVYYWIERYKKISLKSKNSFKLKRTILRLIKKDPTLGVSRLSKILKQSRSLIANLLNELDLNSSDKRIGLSRTIIKDGRIRPELKYEICKNILSQYKTISEVSKEYNIARKTIYEWIKKYQSDGIVLDKYAKAESHPKSFSAKTKEEILNKVVDVPYLSIHKLAKVVNLSSHGVFNVLRDKGLTHLEARITYSQAKKAALAQVPQPAGVFGRVRSVWEKFITGLAPAPPPLEPAKIPFRSLVKPFFASTFVSSLTSLSFVYWIRILTASGGNTIGLLFASLALLMGTFFFIYSMKYYLTVAIVLSFSQQVNSATTGVLHKKRRNFLAWILGIEHEEVVETDTGRGGVLLSRKAPGLEANLDQVSLRKYPFVSVQIPLYNEKYVAVRAIKASTSFDYKGEYEVIICDDSTDETSDIIRKYQEKFLVKGEKLKQIRGEGWVLTEIEIKPGVTLKHLRRTTREGFKGWALKLALTLVNPKTEFISVFDADFVPYPDSLTSFLKYFKIQNSMSEDYTKSNVAAVQGYQWHVLNKSENWITRGVRNEYAGSYVIERSGEEIYGGLKQISGSVYMIRRDVLEEIGWDRSITEDFELTLKLYEKGYKVVYTPYIQAPAECVSTIKRLVRQRMRWAEGHSNNVKRMFKKLLFNPKLTFSEKFEFAYLIPYYLQAFFFLIGTLSWLISETVFQTRLPFWTSIWGWSLVLTNMLSLPLMNSVGLFLEESEGKDYSGIMSFVALSYILVPFQAYASLKGFIEKEEGPWFRTPKTGKITDVLRRGSFYRWVSGILPKGMQSLSDSLRTPIASPAFNFQMEKEGLYGKNVLSEIFNLNFSEAKSSRNLSFAAVRYAKIAGKFFKGGKRFIGSTVLAFSLLLTILISSFAPYIPAIQSAQASEPKFKTVGSDPQIIEFQESQTREISFDRKDPPNKEEIIKNVKNAVKNKEEITTSRIIRKTTKAGKDIDFIFHKEPRVRIKIEGKELDTTTLTIGGKGVRPKRAYISQDKEVVYESIVPNIDLKYSFTGDLIAEEFILKSQEAVNHIGDGVTQSIKTVDVKVVNPNPQAFGFYDDDGRELFQFSAPFAKDAKGEVINDLSISLEKQTFGHKLTKTIGGATKKWLTDPNRTYPVSIDPTVIVSTGIAETEVQFGGLQRKVAYVNSNWYAFYNDGGVVYYKKSSNGTSWGDAVTVSDGDTDNYNPTIDVSSTMMIVFWIDDGAEVIEGRTINTASSDAQGTLCQSASQGTIGSSFITTVAAVSTTAAGVAYSDTSSDTEVDLFYITGLDGTCTVNDIQPGNVTFGTQGSGITAGDRPVLVPISSTRFDMVFQDGDLSYSMFDVSNTEWRRNNQQIANVTDNVYSVTTDSTSIWILSVSGTTDTNFYKCCTASTGLVETATIDSDIGGMTDEADNDIDMDCPSATNCKIVYIDDQDVSAAPKLVFVDCEDANCSTYGSGTPRNIDSDIGSSGSNMGEPAIYCVTSDDCKVAYGDCLDCKNIVSAPLPILALIDCNDETCSSPTQGTVDLDIGSGSSHPHPSLYCPDTTDCKIIYFDDDLNDLYFIDCSNAQCSTWDAFTLMGTNINTTNSNVESSIYCNVATDCHVAFHDSVGGDFTLISCSNAACSTQVTGSPVDIDTDVGGTTVNVPSAIDCSSATTDCKIIYMDFGTSQNDFYFVDCDAATCSSSTITKIDDSVSASTAVRVDMDCVVSTDCKGVYTKDGISVSYYFDCDGASCTTGSVEKITNSDSVATIVCPASDDCKIAYTVADIGGAPDVRFADCTNEYCGPDWASDTAPWSSQTNVSSVSLSYDSSGANLFAFIIKDTNEEAYWKSTSAASISWGSETDIGWSTTGDTLGHISSPLKGSGGVQIGAVVRESTDFEFSGEVPETSLVLLLTLPVLPKLLEKFRKRKIRPKRFKI